MQRWRKSLPISAYPFLTPWYRFFFDCCLFSCCFPFEKQKKKTFVVNESQARDKLDERDSGHRDDLVRMGGRRRTGEYNMYTSNRAELHSGV
jgi:hypothetical protein